MNSFSKNVGFYVIIIAIAILLANFLIPKTNGNLDLTYTQFLQLVEKGKIKEVTMIGSNEIEGIYNGREFYLNIPPEVVPNLMELMVEKNVIINTEPEPSAPWWTAVLSYILPMIILIAVWIFFMQRMQGGGNKVLTFGKSRARLLQDEDKKITFADVANYEEVKEELAEIVEFLKDPGKFNAMGAKVPKGVLLVGPPGTGKTLLARAVAGEAGVPFFIVSGSDFVEMFVGVGASRVRDLFEQAKRNAPCIIFIDELDAVGRQRGAGLGGGHDEREQTLNQLLVEMDGFEGNEGVIVMAATNRPDVLDQALLRPGRFDRQIVVDAPDYQGRLGILKIHVRNKPLADDVDLDALARRTSGFTGADLENLANEAAILAVRRKQRKITMRDFDDAIDRIIVGLERSGRRISEEERKLIAYHETGHAVLNELLDCVERTHKVSIIPRGQAGGYHIPIPKEERMMVTKKDLQDRITVLLGGRAAEEVFLGEISTGASNDLEKATAIARAMVTEYGMSEKLGHITLGHKDAENVFLGRDITRDRNYSEEIAALIDKEIKAIIDNCYEKALTILKENADIVERMVQALFKYEVLNAEQVNKIINGEPLDDEHTPQSKEDNHQANQEAEPEGEQNE
ncbi:cell division protein FtsH [Anoxybacter fermentans]|uniref:ATP-dependent zinc metalloprotease FtsH n=1 Tax=Anoxybacter fermentans TaxID=1323375 RepID=A0A3Q9HS95_9FIRM|nr:ATP-dependent zinc metalloprotease FtsH [Anoxybacter fermentans]AZR74606.1 cell division protein FtsH [Anoxybacter fermentans]